MAGLAAKYNIFINKHASYELFITWRVENPGNPIDVAGYKAILQVRLSFDSPNVLLEASTTDGRIILGSTNGRIQILLSPELTSSLQWDKGIYDLLMQSPSGRVRRIMEGEITVRSGSSRFPTT